MVMFHIWDATDNTRVLLDGRCQGLRSTITVRVAVPGARTPTQSVDLPDLAGFELRVARPGQFADESQRAVQIVGSLAVGTRLPVLQGTAKPGQPDDVGMLPRVRPGPSTADADLGLAPGAASWTDRLEAVPADRGAAAAPMSRCRSGLWSHGCAEGSLCAPLELSRQARRQLAVVRVSTRQYWQGRCLLT
jgi:hypothetical protein